MDAKVQYIFDKNILRKAKFLKKLEYVGLLWNIFPTFAYII